MYDSANQYRGDSIETDLTLRIILVVFQLHLNHQEVQGFRKSPSHVIKYSLIISASRTPNKLKP